MATVKMMGISDEITTCQCCGRKNLKRTAVLDFDGDQRYYGSDCAARALGTHKAGIDGVGKAVAFAQKYLGQYSGKELAKGVAARFGYGTRVRDGKLEIYGETMVAIALPEGN